MYKKTFIFISIILLSLLSLQFVFAQGTVQDIGKVFTQTGITTFIRDFGGNLATGDAGAIAFMKFVLWLVLFTVVSWAGGMVFKSGDKPNQRVSNVVGAVIAFLGVILIPSSLLTSIAATYSGFATLLFILLPILFMIFLYYKLRSGLFQNQPKLAHALMFILSLLIIVFLVKIKSDISAAAQQNVAFAGVFDGSMMTWIILFFTLMAIIHAIGMIPGMGLGSWMKSIGEIGKGKGGPPFGGGGPDSDKADKDRIRDAGIASKQLADASDKYVKELGGLGKMNVTLVDEEIKLYPEQLPIFERIVKELHYLNGIYKAIQEASKYRSDPKIASELANKQIEMNQHFDVLKQGLAQLQLNFQKISGDVKTELTNVSRMSADYGALFGNTEKLENNVAARLGLLNDIKNKMIASIAEITNNIRTMSPEDQGKANNLIGVLNDKMTRNQAQQDQLKVDAAEVSKLKTDLKTAVDKLTRLNDSTKKSYDFLNGISKTLAATVDHIYNSRYDEAGVSINNAVIPTLKTATTNAQEKRNILAELLNADSELDKTEQVLKNLELKLAEAIAKSGEVGGV